MTENATTIASVYEIRIHACSYCQFPNPTRSCDWDATLAGTENVFETEAAALAAIPALMEAFGDTDDSQYAVARIEVLT